MNQCWKPKPRRSQTDSRNKNRWAAFSKNRVPVMASPEQIQKYENLLEIALEEQLTLYQVLEPFSHPENGECGKLVVLTHLLYRLQARQCDLDIALICANSRSEQVLFDALFDRGLKYQTISSLLPEKESFGLIVKLRRGCLDDVPIENNRVDVTIAYDGVFEYSDRLLKQFKQPHTQETPPMIQLITMDTSEARARSRLHKCTHYNDHFVSLRPTDVELFYMPTRTSWCAHFIDWNEYVAEDIVRWLVSGEMDYRVQFPPDNAPLNEIYKAELQERTRRIQDKFKFPKGRDARNNVEGHLRPSLMHTLSPKKQQLIRKQMEQTVSIDCFRRSRKEEAKERTRLERESWEKPKSSGITASQLEKDTINQPSASALLVQNRVL